MIEQYKLTEIDKAKKNDCNKLVKKEEENKLKNTSPYNEDKRTNDIKTYENLSLEDLFEEASSLITNNNISKIINNFSSIHSETKKRFAEDREQKLKHFLENGGSEEDFEYKNEYGIKFKSLLIEYKKKRHEYYQNLDKSLNENLEVRLSIIEELKALYIESKDDSKIFEKFKNIKKRWNNAGNIPKRKHIDIYHTYHHHLENFYEYLDLNREFRRKYLELNRQEKLKLVKRAEELLLEPNIKKASDELQYLHKLWKEETGPVAKEYREEIWKQFKEATDKLHDKKYSFFKKQDLKQEENLQNKLKICDEITILTEEKIDSHIGWQNQIKKFRELQNKFLNVGYVPKYRNKEIWLKYKEICRIFTRKKNNFYRLWKQSQKENLEKKKALIKLAKQLKESEKWEETATKLKEIQADWKTIGHVPKSQTVKIWSEFKSTCDYFFKRYYENKNGSESQLLSNVKRKENIIEKFKRIDFQEEPLLRAIEIINSWQLKWFSKGKIPISHLLKLNKRFFTIVEDRLKEIDAPSGELEICKFLFKCSNFNGNVYKINNEIRILKRLITKSEQKLKQTQTNIEYFSSSTENNPTISEIQKAVKKETQKLNTLNRKLKHLNSPFMLLDVDEEE